MNTHSGGRPRVAVALKLCTLAAVPLILWAYSAGPDAHKTAVPGSGEATCNDVGCHVGTAVNGGGGSVGLSATSGFYTPGVRQVLTIRITDSAARAYGFQLTARLSSDHNVQAGTFAVQSGQLVLCAGRATTDLGDIRPNSGICSASKPLEFVEHSRPSTTGVIAVDWTPPLFGAGPVDLYISANAANGNGNESGDHIYTGSLTLFPNSSQPIPPSIVGTTPTVVLASSSNQTLTLLGNGFEAGLSVRVSYPDGAVRVFAPTMVQNVTSTSLQINTAFSTPGNYRFQVVNPSGLQSALFVLMVNAPLPAPIVSSIFPPVPSTSPSPQLISVNGANFTIGTTATVSSRIGVENFSSPLIQNLSSISLAISPRLTVSGAYSLVVTNPDGRQSQPFSFVVKPTIPAINGITPSALLISNSAQTLRVSGSGFQLGLVMKLGFPNVPPVVVPAAQVAVLSDSVLMVSATFTTKGTYSLVAVTPDGEESNVFAFSVGIPSPLVSAVVNGASFQPFIADGSWVTIQGIDLAPDTAGAGRVWTAEDIHAGVLPRSLDSVSVTIDGKPAAVYFVSARQLNVQAPITGKTGPVEVVVMTSNGPGSPFIANVQTVSPGLFLFTSKYPAAVLADGTTLGPPELIAGVKTRPAKPGETILLFATGLGPTDPEVAAGVVFNGAARTRLPVTVEIGGLQSQVDFAGLTGVGLYQINVVVPDVPDGDRALTVFANGVRTQAGVSISVRR